MRSVAEPPLASVREERVRPKCTTAETRGVTLVALAMIAVWGAAVGMRRPTAEPMVREAYQRSAFAELQGVELGLFNDLQAAAVEIRAIQAETGQWPEPSMLAGEAIAPFVEDAAWVARGRLQWEKRDAHQADHAVYWGRGSGTPVVVKGVTAAPTPDALHEWALVFTGPQVSLWRRTPGGDDPPPAALPRVLVLEGWEQWIGRVAE